MVIFLCLPLLVVLLQPALCLNCASVYNRNPNDSDLQVFCGATVITVEVNWCTARWAGFNASELALSGNLNNTACLGSVDKSVDPPVIRYNIHINSSKDKPCHQPLQIVDEIPDPTGPFSGFLSVQTVVITGYIDTPKSAQGVISYSTDLYYHFTCRYPLEYLFNNTQLSASAVAVATTQNNGSFLDTLRINIFNDSNHKYPLVIPAKGLALRTKVYVEIKTVNLTGNFHVLLDRCYATPSPYNDSLTEQQNFFTGCIVEDITTIINNGNSNNAHFYFESFRFVQHKRQEVSSVYLHCLLRLCEPKTCKKLTAACYSNRRKRALTPFGQTSSDSAAISVGPLYTAGEDLPVTATQSSTNSSGMNAVNATCLLVGVVFVWLLDSFS